MSGKRGIPGPDRRTGLVRPTMTEAEFEKNLATEPAGEDMAAEESTSTVMVASSEGEPAIRSGQGRAGRSARPRASKPRRIQRMFAIEEDLDRKLWLYAIHMGKDRSEIINDLLRPVVTSMVVYDGRDRRGSGSQASTASMAESA
ncbi:MAG: hypothetical protein ACKO5E_21990 [bacterium]